MNWELANEILLLAIKALLIILLPVLAALGKALAEKAHAWLEAQKVLAKAKLGNEVYQLVESAVQMAVTAAEQLDLSGQLEKLALTKKQYALDAAQRALSARGIALNLAELDALIESQVFQEFNWGKQKPAT